MSEQTWLSQEAHDRLRAELEELKNEGRPRISEMIQQAREHGDISENAEYETAKEEQGRLEARIRHIETLLREAEVGGKPSKADVVGPGVLVVLEIDGDEETYFVSTTREERHEKHDVLSTASPIGRAVSGAAPGETVTAEVPAGAVEITVKAVKPS